MSDLLISELPAGERPRERMMRLGVSALSERELLAVLLRNGAPGESALSLADTLLQAYSHDLLRLSQATAAELCGIRGMGLAKAASLSAGLELARRLKEAVLPDLNCLSSPALAAEFMRSRFKQFEQEEFHVIMLNSRNQVIDETLVTLGLLDRSLVHAREVFRPALRCACARIMVCHSHPSGDPRPSQADHQLTEMLLLSGKIIGIALLDHIVLGTPSGDPAHLGYYSFAEHDLMKLPEGTAGQKP